MKEVSFKSLFILFLFISNLCFALDDNLYSYDFVHTNVIPMEISKNSIGVRFFEVNNELNLFINMNHWFSDNLYFASLISPSTDNNINIIYGINFGYKSKIDFDILKNIYFDLGYYSRRFDSVLIDNKWKSISILSEFSFKKSNILCSYSYVFNNTSNNERDSSSFLGFSFIKNIRKLFFINLGVNIFNDYKVYTLPFISVGYKI